MEALESLTFTIKPQTSGLSVEMNFRHDGKPRALAFVWDQSQPPIKIAKRMVTMVEAFKLYSLRDNTVEDDPWLDEG